MRTTRPQEIEAVLKLDGRARYEHFLSRAVDSELVWGLWSDGWALMADDSGNSVFPLWPAPEYAALCAVGEWQGYEAAPIDLTDLLEELLPKLVSSQVRPAIFPTPTGKGVIVSTEALADVLKAELQQYE